MNIMEGDKKMKTKKSGAYAALAAVLLISAVLITNCMDPINPGGLFVPKGKDQPAAFTPPPGKGYVMLKFGAGRTIRPPSSELITDPTLFNHFDVIFKPDPDGPNDPGTLNDEDGEGLNYATLINTAFVLDEGDYIVEVYAFKVAHATVGTSDIQLSAAFGFETLSVDASGDGTLATIYLSEIKGTTYGGTGTFTWRLTPNPSISAATLTITPYPGTSPVSGYNGIDIYNASSITNSATLSPGFYTVDIALSGTKVAPKTIHEILHIYQGMTSYYGTPGVAPAAPIVLPTLNRNVYDVTFNYNDARLTDGTSMDGSEASDEYTHGDTITAPLAPVKDYVKSTGPVAYDLTLEIQDWYTTDRTGDTSTPTSGTWVAGNIFTMGSTMVLRDTTLYARWKKVGVVVSLGFDYSGPTLTDGSISVKNKVGGANFEGLTSLTSRPTIVISFNNDDGDGNDLYENIRWFSGDGVNMSYGDDLASIDIDLASAAFVNLLTEGKHTITLQADRVGGDPESATIEFYIDVDP